MIALEAIPWHLGLSSKLVDMGRPCIISYLFRKVCSGNI